MLSIIRQYASSVGIEIETEGSNLTLKKKNQAISIPYHEQAPLEYKLIVIKEFSNAEDN